MVDLLFSLTWVKFRPCYKRDYTTVVDFGSLQNSLPLKSYLVSTENINYIVYSIISHEMSDYQSVLFFTSFVTFIYPYIVELPICVLLAKLHTMIHTILNKIQGHFQLSFLNFTYMQTFSFHFQHFMMVKTFRYLHKLA